MCDREAWKDGSMEGWKDVKDVKANNETNVLYKRKRRRAE